MLSSYIADKARLELECENEVDTELLARFIDKHPVEYRNKWNEIKGDASLAWMNLETKRIHLAKLSGRSLVFGKVMYVNNGHNDHVGYIYASTEASFDAVNKEFAGTYQVIECETIEDGTEIVMIDGAIIERVKCETLGSWAPSGRTWGNGNSGYTSWSDLDEYYSHRPKTKHDWSQYHPAVVTYTEKTLPLKVYSQFTDAAMIMPLDMELPVSTHTVKFKNGTREITYLDETAQFLRMSKTPSGMVTMVTTTPLGDDQLVMVYKTVWEQIQKDAIDYLNTIDSI
jgi:hypothetical protein